MYTCILHVPYTGVKCKTQTGHTYFKYSVCVDNKVKFALLTTDELATVRRE